MYAPSAEITVLVCFGACHFWKLILNSEEDVFTHHVISHEKLKLKLLPEVRWDHKEENHLSGSQMSVRAILGQPQCPCVTLLFQGRAVRELCPSWSPSRTRGLQG